MRQGYKKNILLYKYYFVFSGALFIYPIEILFFQYKGMSFVDIMIIESLISLIQLIMEIPSGILADKIGCKKAVIGGIVLEIVAFLVLIVSIEMLWTFFYAITLAVGMSLISGADVAMLYESHVLIGEEDMYGNTIRDAGTMKMWVLAIVTIFSGILFEVNPIFPYIFSIVFLTIALLFACMFREVNLLNKDNNKVNWTETRKALLINKKIYWIISIAILFNILFSDMNYLLQAYMKALDIRTSFFGAVFFVCNIISAVAFRMSEKIINTLREYTKLFMAIALGVVFSLAGIVHNYFILILLCLLRVCVATVMPLLNVTINENIDSGHRATFLSVYYASINAVMILIDPIVGKFLDYIGVFKVYLMLGGVSCVLCVLLAIERRINSNE